MDAEGGIGQQIGHYELIKELGRGGMGVVYKAHEASLGRMVALKVLPQHLAGSESFIKRFKREAQAVAALNHPNIVTIYNIGQEGDLHYIAMEFVKGQSLQELLSERGPFEPEEALRIVKQVASALGLAHESGIVHRDIKPHNIMIDQAGRAKVMDFGIARMAQQLQTSALTKTGDILGTPAYISPEQCKGKEIDGRSDLYSLGVVLYQMLAGFLPFGGETPLELIQKILFEPPPPIQEYNPAVSAAVNAVIERLLKKDPDERYADAAELEADIQSVLGSGELAATQPGRARTPAPIPRRPSDEPPPLTPALMRLQRQTGGTDSGFMTPLPARVGRRVGMAVGALLVIALTGGVGMAAIHWLQGKASRAKPPIAAPGDPQPAATLPPAATSVPPPTPGAAPADLPLPVIEWTEAPEEGARLRKREVKFSWRVANRAIAEGFLIGLNIPNPTIKITDMTKTFVLSETGNQTVMVVPIGANGEQGIPIIRGFNYEINLPPTLEASLSSESVRQGAIVSLDASARDPDEDATRIEARINEGEWMAVDEFEAASAALAPGFHRVQARAIDFEGAESVERVWTLEVKPVETPEPTPSPFATPLPSPMPPTPMPEPPSNSIGALTPLDKKLYAQAKQLYRGTFAGGAEDARRVLGDLETAASPIAKMLAALVYWEGRGAAPKSEQKAGALSRAAIGGLQPLAAEGDPEAQFLLGSALGEGIGIVADRDLAAVWMRRAAEAGHRDAAARLGTFYDQGRGVPANPQESARWYEKAAAGGDPRAAHNLGVSSERGDGARQDDIAAFEHYRRAAEAGYAPSMHNLALCYEEGRGVQKDTEKAKEWYRRAAEKGEALSMNNLAELIEWRSGGDGDDREAAEWYRKSAEAGNAAAMANLGYLYDSGRGVARDPLEAARWYRKAADAGSARGMFNLGVCHELGEGTPQDDAQAAAWYRKAAEAGHVDGMTNYARMLELGKGVAPDLQSAVTWYQKAADQDDERAKASLKRLGR